MKARGARPIAFTVFECLGTQMKHDARVFELASQSRLRNKRNGNILDFFHMFSASLLLRRTVLLWRSVFSDRVSLMLSQYYG